MDTDKVIQDLNRRALQRGVPGIVQMNPLICMLKN
jgi:hypothetical protein